MNRKVDVYNRFSFPKRHVNQAWMDRVYLDQTDPETTEKGIDLDISFYYAGIPYKRNCDTTVFIKLSSAACEMAISSDWYYTCIIYNSLKGRFKLFF